MARKISTNAIAAAGSRYIEARRLVIARADAQQRLTWSAVYPKESARTKLHRAAVSLVARRAGEVRSVPTSVSPVGVAGIFIGERGPECGIAAVGTVGFLDLRKFLLAQYVDPSSTCTRTRRRRRAMNKTTTAGAVRPSSARLCVPHEDVQRIRLNSSSPIRISLRSPRPSRCLSAIHAHCQRRP